MRRGWKLVVLAPLAIGGVVLFVAIGGALVQYLWNWLLPSLFGWPSITFWQALGLLALCRIFFGGFGVHRGRGYGMGFRRGRGRRWDRMNDDERERFRQTTRDRCGRGGAPVDAPPA
jgi:hypothetical protein